VLVQRTPDVNWIAEAKMRCAQKNTAGFTWPLLIAYPTDHNEADDQEPSEEDLAHVDKVLIQTSSLDP